ncbi:MAG: M56 family metallopeptidase [Verrucomicrobiota bacterium]
MTTPDLYFWTRLLVRLAAEAACVVGIALLLDRLIRPSFWRRAVWQSAAVCLLLLTVSELSGFGRGLASYLFGHARPAEKAAAWTRPVVAAPLPSSSSSPLPAHPPPRSFAPASISLPPPAVEAGISQPVWWPGLIWLGGGLVILGRVAVAHLLFISLRRRRPHPAHGDLNDRADAILQRLAVRRKIRVLQSPGLTGPLAFGILRPSVGLPADFGAKFSRAEQDAMLAHELAHLAAHDPLWYLLADVCSAALWWHPPAWWARRRLHRASELAADEAAALFPDGPAALAGCLVTLGKQMTQLPAAGWMGVEGGGFRSNLAERVQRLLRLADTARQPSYGWRAHAARCGLILAVSAAAVGLTGCLQSRDAVKQPTLRANLSQSWDASPALTVWRSALPAIKPAPATPNPVIAMPARFDRGVVDAAQPVSPSAPAANTAAGPADASDARDAIVRKLQSVKLHQVPSGFEQGLPLSEVLKILTQLATNNAADHTGLNFLFNPRGGLAGSPAGEMADPATISIKITPPLRNVNLLQLLDAIRQMADQPLDFAVSDYAVWFFVKPLPPAALESALQPFLGPAPGTGQVPHAEGEKRSAQSSGSAPGASQERQANMSKLQDIRLKEQPSGFEQGLPLTEVLKILNQLSISNAADHAGANFLFHPRVGANPAGAPVDPSTITVRITPPLKNVTLLQFMDAICQMADQPIDLSMTDYAVWFFVKAPVPAPQESKTPLPLGFQWQYNGTPLLAPPETRTPPVPDSRATTNPATPAPSVAPDKAPSPSAPIPVQTLTNETPNPGDVQTVKETVHLHSLDPMQVVNGLGPLIRPGSQMGIAAKIGRDVVVMGHQADVRRFAQMITAIDSDGEGDLQVFLLRSGDSKDIASKLMALFYSFVFYHGQIRPSADESSKPIRVRVNAVSDDQNNAVVVRALPELMPGISNIIQQLDIPQKDDIQIRRFVIENADCTDVANELLALYPDPNLQTSQQNQDPRRRAALKKQIVIKAVPDPRTQSVLVTASKYTMAQIERVIYQLETNKPLPIYPWPPPFISNALSDAPKR